MYIIDRTQNPTGKSIPNTERFMIRARKQIADAVAAMVQVGSIDAAASGKGNLVPIIPTDNIHEPHFWVDSKESDWSKILPGNPATDDFSFFAPPCLFQKPTSQLSNYIMKYVEGDKIPKPPESTTGAGAGGAETSMDEFAFILSEEDWDKFLFDQLELPNQDNSKVKLSLPSWRKAGFSLSGTPANLNYNRTMRNSFARKFGLGRPKNDEIDELQKLIDNTTDPELLHELNLALETLKHRMEVIPWIDPIDVRYSTHVKEMQPKFNAVMFCLMDVSGSMTQHMKELAKVFYVFLYKFLKRKYDKVEVVFIRHHHQASEVDEETFFYSPETGGTVVSTALEEMLKIIKDRYPLNEWNIYGAQASDGDNTGSDNKTVEQLLLTKIIPIIQHYAYVEITRHYDEDFFFLASGTKYKSTLWNLYETIALKHENKFAMVKINKKTDVWPIMIKLFGEK